MKFFIKSMCPFSLLEKNGFREYEAYKCPSFDIPTRKTLLNMVIGHKQTVIFKVKEQLRKLEYPNVSVDGWSDATMRCFNGYIVQGISTEWEIVNIPITFEFVSGSHTGKAIKDQYDNIIDKFGIRDKVFKIVADQGIIINIIFYYYILIYHYTYKSRQCKECV